MPKKSLEDRIKKEILSHEKQTKEEITEVRAYKKRETGFNKKEEIIVTYYTK